MWLIIRIDHSRNNSSSNNQKENDDKSKNKPKKAKKSVPKLLIYTSPSINDTPSKNNRYNDEISYINQLTGRNYSTETTRTSAKGLTLTQRSKSHKKRIIEQSSTHIPSIRKNDRGGTFFIEKKKQKSVLSKILNKIEAKTKINKISLTERKNDDNITFIKLLVNCPDRRDSTNSRESILLQKELRKIKPKREEEINEENSRRASSINIVPESFKTFPKLSRKGTDVQVAKNMNTLEDSSNQQKKLSTFGRSNIFKRKNTERVPTTNKHNFINHTYIKQNEESLAQEQKKMLRKRLKLRFLKMDEELYNYNKGDYENMSKEGNTFSLYNLLRVSKFLSIVKPKAKIENELPQEIEPTEYLNKDQLLIRNFYASKTLQKIGPAKYIKTKLRPSTNRKFIEKIGVFFGKG